VSSNASISPSEILVSGCVQNNFKRFMLQVSQSKSLLKKRLNADCGGAFLPISYSRIGVVEQCSAILLTELPFAIKPEI